MNKTCLTYKIQQSKDKTSAYFQVDEYSELLPVLNLILFSNFTNMT